MKHTLKSLLITSVLTLPTVLGSGALDSDALADKEDPRNTASNTPVDNEDPINAASVEQSPLLDIESITNLINNAPYLPLQKDVCLERASKGVPPNATLSDFWGSATFFILKASVHKITPSEKLIVT